MDEVVCELFYFVKREIYPGYFVSVDQQQQFVAGGEERDKTHGVGEVVVGQAEVVTSTTTAISGIIYS